MRLKVLSVIFFSFLLGCINKTKKIESENKKIDTVIQKPYGNSVDTEDTLLLDTVKYDQVLLNNLPLQIDTLTEIKTLGIPSSRNVYGLGTCYRFGDAILWHFNDCVYYIYKDSLYFHEFYFDNNYKSQDFTIKFPRLTISAKTKISEFKNAYPTSFTNSKQRLSNTVIFRTGEPLQCQFRFEYKDDKLWRFAVGM